MSRELPSRPNLEHLKTQAKDLLEAHRRGDPAAFARIRGALPACAGLSDDAIARYPFALHDAQSSIAREYGLASWAELRNAVSSRPAELDPTNLIAKLTGAPPPQTVVDAAERAFATRAARANTQPELPETLPAIPVRNALPVAGAVFPLLLGRPSSLAAIAAAERAEPPLLAVFAQRAAETENPSFDDLHPHGCLAHVHFTQPAAEAGQVWLVLEALRWLRLESVEQTTPYHRVRASEFAPVSDDAERVAELEQTLRALARAAAAHRPDASEVLPLIDRISDAGQLADLVVANLPGSVAETAAYAAETSLVARLERALARLQAAAAASSA